MVVFPEHLPCARPRLESSQALTHFVLMTLCSRFCYRPHCRGEETGLVVPWASLTSPKQRMHFCFWNPTWHILCFSYETYCTLPCTSSNSSIVPSPLVHWQLPGDGATLFPWYCQGRRSNCLSGSPGQFFRQNTAEAWALHPGGSGCWLVL